MAEVDTTKRIHVNRNFGTPYRATTLKGYTVERHDKLIGPNNSVVLCAEYDDHFVYRNPHVIYDNAMEPMFLCTCGAIAIQVWGDQVPSSHQINKDKTTQFVSISAGTEDLHLVRATSDAVGNGVDLGTTPTNIEIDADGQNRDALGAVWDIGPFQTFAEDPDGMKGAMGIVHDIVRVTNMKIVRGISS